MTQGQDGGEAMSGKRVIDIVNEAAGWDDQDKEFRDAIDRAFSPLNYLLHFGRTRKEQEANAEAVIRNYNRVKADVAGPSPARADFTTFLNAIKVVNGYRGSTYTGRLLLDSGFNRGEVGQLCVGYAESGDEFDQMSDEKFDRYSDNLNLTHFRRWTSTKYHESKAAKGTMAEELSEALGDDPHVSATYGDEPKDFTPEKEPTVWVQGADGTPVEYGYVAPAIEAMERGGEGIDLPVRWIRRGFTDARGTRFYIYYGDEAGRYVGDLQGIDREDAEELMALLASQGRREDLEALPAAG